MLQPVRQAPHGLPLGPARPRRHALLRRRRHVGKEALRAERASQALITSYSAQHGRGRSPGHHEGFQPAGKAQEGYAGKVDPLRPRQRQQPVERPLPGRAEAELRRTDPTGISELRKGARCGRAVAAWAGRVPPVACYLSRMTIAKIIFGIERVADPAFRSELESWLRDGARAWFGDRILDVDEAVLLAWRRLVMEGQKARYTYSQPDALIVATARGHGLVVATRSVEDFVQAGLPILNPWRGTK